ncbi:hypothetical protein [Thermoflavimicrobium dichotomicum]|uniref:Uncharacterized protein n=1 Tax=Thermoflavimicrobium dichotomicum TaxID=46223 RepID=A0A1I3JKW4_9BACL|nr:hypothetical protein [Thermoflavimicrobium dichotomicum]SFI60796.1 hypothetical protein SAMN05421852_101109 [Thermoflavimicrobium dichotomicum]
MKERTAYFDDDHINKRTDLERRIRRYKKELEYLIHQEEEELARLDKKMEMLRFPLLFEEEE